MEPADGTRRNETLTLHRPASARIAPRFGRADTGGCNRTHPARPFIYKGRAGGMRCKPWQTTKSMTTKRTQKQERAGCDQAGKPTFALTLQAVPGWGDVPAIIRLRKFLKAALRSYGLKCTECREAEPTAATAAGESAHGVCTIDPGRSGQGAARGGRTQAHPTPRGLGTTFPRAPGDPAPAKSTIYLIHTDGALPLSGPRGVVELTAATPTDTMTCVAPAPLFSPPAEIPAIGCVRSSALPPLVTLPAVPCPQDAPPQAPSPLGRRPRPAPAVDTQALPQVRGTAEQQD